jgi:pimeloyl-ACP methyl ester carboxylesterase
MAGLIAQTLRRPLVVNQTHYRVVAGERITIQAPPDSQTFMRSAKTRIAVASGASNRTFPIAPNAAGDQVLLGFPLTTKPGDYSVELSFVSGAGEERSTTFQVTVEPFATTVASSGVPPVVLLDGWQMPRAAACPMYSDSTQTFGNLQGYLGASPNFVPTVYFFENCTECPNCAIEQLGADLGTFLNSIQYSDGTPVPQVDVVAHSMGGLIVRSYLAGKQQASGAFSPPATPKILKAVFIGTPHFGSFQADSPVADILFFAGNQTNEMKRGSRFL